MKKIKKDFRINDIPVLMVPFLILGLFNYNDYKPVYADNIYIVGYITGLLFVSFILGVLLELIVAYYRKS